MKRTANWFSENWPWLWFFTPLVGWIVVCSKVGMVLGLPWWAALLLSLIAGVICHCIAGRSDCGGSSVVEMGCGSTIGLVLVGSLVPVFSQAREHVREKQCRANLTRLATRLQDYAARHGGRLPAPESWTALLHCPASKQLYLYEAGKNGILVRERTHAHQGRMLLLRTDGTIQTIKALSSPPPPQKIASR